MGWFKQLSLSWIILSAACVSCQELTSTLREGNRTCPGDEVNFTCIVRGPSNLQVLAVAWSSTEYIGQSSSLQLSTANMIGAFETSTDMDGSITATATVTSNTNINGELILETTLRITAVVASTVTCRDPNRGPASIEFTISVVPGVPMDITAGEISRSSDICVILVTWAPPTNSDTSDIAQYRVYVPSRNIVVTVSSAPPPVTTLRVQNCGDDIRVQIAAVSRVGCVGMNSSEVQPILRPTVSTDDGSATTEGGSTSTSSQLGIGAIVGIAISVIILLTLCFLGLTFVGIYMYYVYIADKFTEKPTDTKELTEATGTDKPAETTDTEKAIHSEVQEMLTHDLSILFQEKFQKYLVDFYIAFKKDLPEDKLSSVKELYRMMENRTLLSKRYIKEAIKEALKIIKVEHGENVEKVLSYLKVNVPSVLPSFDDKLKDKDTDITMDSLIRAAKQKVHEEIFDELMEIMDNTEPEIVEGLLRTMFEELQTYLQSKASSIELKQVPNLPGHPNSKDDIPMEPSGEEDPMEFPT